MRFKIYRTSDNYGAKFNETPPCKNAFVVEEQKPLLEWIRDESAKPILFDTGKTKIVKHWEVRINTLEDLIEIQMEVEYPLIFDEDSIEVYDDYRE